MHPDPDAASLSSAAIPRKTLWAGRIVSALPVLMLLMSGVMKLVKPAAVTEGFVRLGYPESLALGIGLLELVCTLLYVVPRTAVLGAVLLTGYLGGAVATHVRVGDPYFGPVLLGILIWGGLYLRDPRLRALLPLRSNPCTACTASGRKRPVLKAVLAGLATVVVVFVLVAALEPSEFRIVRSTTISAPPAAVFAQVNDFHNWDDWSPWAKLDPAAKYAFKGSASGKDAAFTWSGNNEVGEGRMTITESRPPELVEIKLDFIRPFPSTSTTEFTFQPQGDGNQTLVTWTMSGENDLIGKAFCLFMNMDKMVGGDFDRGLAQMKNVTEAAAP